MAARSKARKRALDILFEAELRALPAGETLRDRLAAADPPLNEYAVTLVEGVAEHLEAIDTALADRSTGWALDRMPGVDRNLLRIAAYELLFADDVPDGVAISEAVTLAGLLSTEQSPAFVNGLLAKLAEDKAMLLQ